MSEDELEAVSGGWAITLGGIAIASSPAWASVVLPVFGVCIAFGLAKYGISKLKKTIKK